MTGHDIAERLARRLADACGAATITVDDVRTMTGGAAREAWRLDVSVAQEGGAATKRTFVALLFRPGGQGRFSGVDEAVLLQAAADAGVPVPRVVCAGEEELGRPYYVMEYVEGETIGRRLVRDERFAPIRAALPEQLGNALAAIHRVPIDALAFLPRPPAKKPVARAAIDEVVEIYRAIAMDPHPAFELAIRWLLRRVPETTDTTLVHGDFRIGNVMVHEQDGLRAVLDWELAHVGDPIQDLGWACVRSWRFGRDDLTCGGVGRREDLVAAYERASGRTVDPEALRFWEVFGNLHWGVITLMQVRPFLDKTYRSIELAGIGRRAAETEWELLNLIEGKGI